MTLLTSKQVQDMLKGEWDNPLPYFNKSTAQLWDEDYEAYISEGGNYITEEEGEEARFDQEAFAGKRGMLDFVDFLVLRHAIKEMKFTDEERQKLDQAIRATSASMEGLKAERIENLLADWRGERASMEAQLLQMIKFAAANNPQHEDWQNTVKSILTDYVYTNHMCYAAAKMLAHVDEPDEVCVPLRPPAQRKDESKEDYKKRLIEYATTL